jgi:hypothetical protein
VFESRRARHLKIKAFKVYDLKAFFVSKLPATSLLSFIIAGHAWRIQAVGR